jgi:hypothetical protein
LGVDFHVCPVMKVPTSTADGPAYWLRRAEEARRSADDMVDLVSKRTLLDIARAYEELASFAASKCGSDKGPAQEPEQP